MPKPPVILVGVDGGASSLEALLYAAGVAETLSAEVVVVHVPPYPLLFGLPSPLSAAGLVMLTQDARAEDIRQRVGNLLSLTGVPWRFVVVDGPVAQALVELAARYEARVVVVGKPRCTLWHRLRHLLVPSVPNCLNGIARHQAVLVA